MIIEHINISAPKALLDKEKSFFCNVFDLEVGFRPGFQRQGYWLYSGKQALIHLTESNEHFPTEKPGFLDHIAFQLTGLHSLLAKLVDKDIPFHTDSLPEIGMTQVFFKSPSGVGLEANFLDESI